MTPGDADAASLDGVEVPLERDVRHRDLLGLAPSPVVVLAHDGTILYVNDSADALWRDADAGTLVGSHFAEVTHAGGQAALHDVLARARLHDRGTDLVVETDPTGDRSLVLEIRFANLDWDGRPAVAGFAQDVTRWASDQEDLRRKALFDELTGLPNRTLLIERLDHALAGRHRSGARPLVLFLDLDRFKEVNDSYGHQAGDRLLVAFAEHLQAAVRAQDTVARFGGDEFVVLVEDAPNLGDAVAVAQRVAEPFEVEVATDAAVTVGASVGLAGGPGIEDIEEGAEDLLQAADTAMYQAKARGGGIEFYTPALQRKARYRLQLDTDLRHAVAEERIDVAFQPLVELGTGRVVGVEALARWHHVDHGELPAGVFIGLAEEAGVIGPLGRQVMDRAVDAVRRWRQEGLVGPGFALHVNVSPRQLVGDELARQVAGLPGGASSVGLVLELTETSIMVPDQDISSALVQLRHAGARIAVDDFGTGYSSLASLADLPVDALKLDRRFVDRLEDQRARRVADAVVALGHALDLEVVAEGVETPDQAAAVRALGVGLAQGFHFGHPMTAATFGRFLATTG